jgi:LacI family transcriptional regulator
MGDQCQRRTDDPSSAVTGMSVPTLRDVAARAGVHVATASRALNAQTRHLVNQKTAVRVLDAAQALGYQPNPIARGLRTNQSMSVGVVIPDLTNPLFPPIVRGIEDGLMAEGYATLLVSTDNNPEREATLIRALRGRQVDGFFFASARVEHPAIDQLARERVPLVLVNRRLESNNLPSVTADDASGVLLALRHVTDLGHTRIAYLAGPQWTSTGQARLHAFRTGMTDLGLDPTRVVEAGQWSEAEGERGMAQLMASYPGFTAVLAGNDLLALGCYDFMAQGGIQCPGQLSVVGFNDVQFMDKVRPALTTVALPQYEIGVTAARLMLERIRQPNVAPTSVELPVTLKVRESTAAPNAL